MTPTPAPPADASRRHRVLLPLLLLAGLLVGIAGVGLWMWANRPRLKQEHVREVAQAALQREAAESFLVTGVLHATGTATITSTRTLLPGLLDVDVDRTRAQVRVPARMTYGIDVRRIRPEMIRLHGDTLVEVALPPVELYDVSPDLSEIRIRTTRGWLRLGGESRDIVAQRALSSVQRSLRRRGEEHVETSMRPRLNTARAIELLLRPVLEAAGMEDPRIRFEVAEGVVSEIER